MSSTFISGGIESRLEMQPQKALVALHLKYFRVSETNLVFGRKWGHPSLVDLISILISGSGTLVVE